MDGPTAAHEHVLEHGVVAPAPGLEEREGVGLPHLEVQGVEVQPATRGAQHRGVALHAHDARPRRQRPGQARRAAAAEAQHQHAASARRWQPDQGRRQGVPDRAARVRAGDVARGQRPVDVELVSPLPTLHAHARARTISVH